MEAVEFKPMHKLIPEMEGKRFAVKHFVPEKPDMMMLFREARDGMSRITRFREISPDKTYIKLVELNKCIWMSDTPMETKSNQEFIEKANGDVLIFGLGIGLIIFPLLDKKEVKSITIVEKEQEVINMISPYLKHKKITIILGDAFSHDFGKKKFDTIYFDIWKDISYKNYPEMVVLHKRYRKNYNTKNPNRYISSWFRDFCRMEFKESGDSVDDFISALGGSMNKLLLTLEKNPIP